MTCFPSWPSAAVWASELELALTPSCLWPSWLEAAAVSLVATTTTDDADDADGPDEEAATAVGDTVVALMLAATAATTKRRGATTLSADKLTISGESVKTTYLFLHRFVSCCFYWIQYWLCIFMFRSPS